MKMSKRTRKPAEQGCRRTPATPPTLADHAVRRLLLLG
jgi:hypothetical protein